MNEAQSIPRAGPRLRITPLGNLGNQMLQYMWALNLKRSVSNIDISGHSLPLWGLGAQVPQDFPARSLRIGGHLNSVDQVARLLRSGVVRDVTLTGLGFRMANLAPAEFYQPVFDGGAVAATGYGDDHVVLNVRAAEILANRHPDYRPLPFSFYDEVISGSGKRPVFLGQLGDDEYSRRLRARYPDAVFQESRGALADFETLRRSHEIALGVSTFSWLAAWLSQAKVIHYPLCGWLNPLQRPEIDLTPVGDPRYRFYDFGPKKSWSASAADIEELWRPHRHQTLDGGALRSLRDKAQSRIAFKRAWFYAKKELQARLLRSGALA